MWEPAKRGSRRVLRDSALWPPRADTAGPVIACVLLGVGTQVPHITGAQSVTGTVVLTVKADLLEPCLHSAKRARGEARCPN